MLISVSNINKTFIDKQVLKDVSFHLNEHDKCALIGINGCGKTTLLNIIIGETVAKSKNAGDISVYKAYALSPDSGSVFLSKDTTVGYLPQNAILDSDNTIYDEVLEIKRPLLDMQDRLRDMESSLESLTGQELNKRLEEYHTLSEEFDRAGGYMIDSEVSGTLKGLGFKEDEFSSCTATLSGGQKTRVALAKLLVGCPDLIILDEPTNHLDISAITWLENYLRSYKGAVLIVSHDRYFLDRIVDKVVELEYGKTTVFTGNYTDYAVKKESLRIAALNAYMNQQRDIKHQQEVIEKLRSFNREKSIKRADSRQKMLDKVELINKPLELNDKMQIVLTPRIESGKDVLIIEGLSKSYDTLLFKDVNILLRKGEHVAVIGDNGTGKTTLLKIINSLIEADSGSVTLGANVTIGYYDQEHHVLNDDNTIFNEISDAYPTLKEVEIRNTLAAFLFTGDDVFKKIGSLSGGEKGRVSLAKLMLGEANFLILDEPTNHLDMASKEILEAAVNNYTGTVLYVSHDRYFINKTAERILELSGYGFKEYQGDYDYYLEKKEATLSANPTTDIRNDKVSSATSVSLSSDNEAASTASSAAADYKAMKAAAAEEKKLKRLIQESEERINEYETKLNEIATKLNDPANGSNVELLLSLQKDHDEIEALLEEELNEWERLNIN